MLIDNYFKVLKAVMLTYIKADAIELQEKKRLQAFLAEILRVGCLKVSGVEK